MLLTVRSVKGHDGPSKITLELSGIKNKHINQCNRTESLETDPLTYGQLIFDKGTKVI